MYKLKHFHIQEFVDIDTFRRLGNRSYLVMDERILVMADKIREYFGKPMIINYAGRQYRGFRPPQWLGTRYSQHRFGRAIDFTIDGLTAEEVRRTILANKCKDAFKQITAMEKNVSWVHVDIRTLQGARIFLFNK